MKTQTTGESLTDTSNPKGYWNTYWTLCEAHEKKILWTTKYLNEAYGDYRANRENGALQDNPAGELKYDGTAVGEKQSGYYTTRYRVKYTEGPGDKAWMEEKDLNYLTRLAREGSLMQIEPAWREVLTAWEPESKSVAAIASVEKAVKLCAEVETKRRKTEEEHIWSITEPHLRSLLQQQDIKIEQLLNEQRIQQEAFQKMLMQQLQAQQKQITQQLQEQQKQFKEDQTQLKFQFETIIQQLNHKISELMVNPNNKTNTLTTNLTTQVDPISFFKADNTTVWRDVIACRDYAHFSFLIERQISPRGISFISIVEDKKLQAYRNLLRLKGAIFTPQELAEDLNDALSDVDKKMGDETLLKNLYEDIAELIRLIETNTLPFETQRACDDLMATKLLPAVKKSNVPAHFQKVFLDKIKCIQAREYLDWLSGKFDSEIFREVNRLIVHQYWEQLRTGGEKENPNSSFILQNIALYFIEHYRKQDFPQQAQKEIAEAFTADILKRYTRNDIDASFWAAIACEAKQIYDENVDKAAGMAASMESYDQQAYGQQAIEAVIQKWRAHELAPATHIAVEQMLFTIEEEISLPLDIRQNLDKKGIERFLNQIRKNEIDDPLIKMSLEDQVQKLIWNIKANDEDYKKVLQLIIQDWHDQKLDQASSKYLESCITRLWQEKLEQIHVALNPWLKASSTETKTETGMITISLQPKPV